MPHEQVDRLSNLFSDLVGELPDPNVSSNAETRASTRLSFQRLRRGIEELALVGGNHLTDAEIWELASQMQGSQSEECSTAFFDNVDEDAKEARLECPDLGFEDVLASLLNWEIIQKREDWRSMATEIFAAMDSDGDGVLDVQELKALLPGEDASDLREMMDMEGCAKGGCIALADFLDMLRAETAETLHLFPSSGSAEF